MAFAIAVFGDLNWVHWGRDMTIDGMPLFPPGYDE
jgi:hypothetical protein